MRGELTPGIGSQQGYAEGITVVILLDRWLSNLLHGLVA